MSIALNVAGCLVFTPAAAAAAATSRSPGVPWDPMSTALGFQAADFLIPLDRVTEKFRSVMRGSIADQSNTARWRPASTDQIQETDEAWLIMLDTAGFSTEELRIHANRNELRVHAEHKCTDPTLCVKRRFQREYDLSATSLDLDHVSSRRTSDGVLEIRLPKTKDRRIEIVVEDIQVPPPAEDPVSEPKDPRSNEPENTEPAQAPPVDEAKLVAGKV